jgi:hypothetical protein
MDRRSFLTALAGFVGVTAFAGATATAEAAGLSPAVLKDEPTAEGFFNRLGELPDGDVENVYHGRRRGRRWRRYRRHHFRRRYHRRRHYRRYRSCRWRMTYYGWRRVCRWWW